MPRNAPTCGPSTSIRQGFVRSARPRLRPSCNPGYKPSDDASSSRRKRPAKYRDPQNPEQPWSGLGRTPKWVQVIDVRHVRRPCSRRIAPELGAPARRQPRDAARPPARSVALHPLVLDARLWVSAALVGIVLRGPSLFLSPKAIHHVRTENYIAAMAHGPVTGPRPRENGWE